MKSFKIAASKFPNPMEWFLVLADSKGQARRIFIQVKGNYDIFSVMEVKNCLVFHLDKNKE